MQVLYIEDNSLDRMAFERVIQKCFLPVQYSSVESLCEGISRIRSGTYDLIFADLKLPDGSALDLLKEIGKTDSIIIILTGVSDIHTAVEAIKRGAYDYIVKDVSREYLQKIPDYLEMITKNRSDSDHRGISDKISSIPERASPLGIMVRDPVTDTILYYNSRFAYHCEISPYGGDLSRADHLRIWEYVCSEYGITSEFLSLSHHERGGHTMYIHPSPEEFHPPLYSFLLPVCGGGIRQVLLMYEECQVFGTISDAFSPESLDSLPILAGGIAHEMNNMLTAILGEISLVRQHLLSDGSGILCFDRTEQAILHGKDIATRLLTYADGGHPVVQPVQLRKILLDILALHTGGEVDVIIDLPEDLPPLLADPDLIRTALRAVIMNAVEASASTLSPVCITARLSHIPGKGQDLTPCLAIDVRDDGTGVGSFARACVFHPFFTTKEGHLGLGLTSAKSIIDRHSGLIDVISSRGEGTVVRLYLPIDPDYTAVSADRVPSAKNRENPEGIRVLVMDDEPGIREIAQVILEKEGFQVDLFSRGEDVIPAVFDAYESLSPYQIAILDLNIPGGMGGKEAVREIARLSPSTLNIVSSGYSDENLNSRYREYGFHASLPKPYYPRDLVSLVFSLLDTHFKDKK